MEKELTMDENMVSALLVERAAFARQGLADRVSLVDVELARHGYEPPREAKQEAKRTAAPKRPARRG